MTSFIIDTHSLYSYTSSLSLKHSLDGWEDDGHKDTTDPTASPSWKGDDWSSDGWQVTDFVPQIEVLFLTETTVYSPLIFLLNPRTMGIIMCARHTSNARINMIEWINIPTFTKWVQLVDVTPRMIKCFGVANAQVLINTIA